MHSLNATNVFVECMHMAAIARWWQVCTASAAAATNSRAM